MDNDNTPALPVASPCNFQENAPKNTLPPLNSANILPEFPVEFLPPVIRDYVKADLKTYRFMWICPQHMCLQYLRSAVSRK